MGAPGRIYSPECILVSVDRCEARFASGTGGSVQVLDREKMRIDRRSCIELAEKS